MFVRPKRRQFFFDVFYATFVIFRAPKIHKIIMKIKEVISPVAERTMISTGILQEYQLRGKKEQTDLEKKIKTQS